MSTLDFEDLDKYLLSQKGRIIHQIWFGTIPNKFTAKKAYKKLKKCRDSVLIKNPTWLRFEWNKELCLKLVKTFFPQHQDMYKNYKYEIQRCDVIRYFILYRYGGWYVDMDYFCNKSFDEVHKIYRNKIYLVQTPNKTFFQDSDYVSNSLMYSVPNHPFWKEVFIHLEKNQFATYMSKHLKVMFTTGPGIINRIYSYYKYRYKVKSLPYEKFQPFGVNDIKKFNLTDDIYTVHMVNSSWSGKDTKILDFLLTEWKILLFLLFIFLLLLIVTKK